LVEKQHGRWISAMPGIVSSADLPVHGCRELILKVHGRHPLTWLWHVYCLQMGVHAGGLAMRYWKYFALLGLLVILAGTAANAQVRFGVGIGIGPGYVPPPAYIGPPPDCPYGYYGYYPYACAPYGYYGPAYFDGGVFIGAGPWFHGFYRGYYGPGYRYFGRDYDRGFRDRDGFRDFHGQRDFRGGRDFHGGGFRGANGFRGNGDFHGGGFHGGGQFHGGGGSHGGGSRGGGHR
jgi:uncharacterized membrane protein YgcG